MEPSPTPWHLFDNGTEIWAQGPPDAPVIVVADTQLTSGPVSDRAIADARRIVDAVNAYDRLRAIEQAARAWAAWAACPQGAQCAECDDRLLDAIAALDAPPAETPQ